MDIIKLVNDNKDYLINLRRYFHSYPEISMQEFNTAKKIEEELDLLHIPHRRVGETGVYAWIDGELSVSDKIIVLRADTDALAMTDLKTTEYASKNESVCHACGHDAHTATLLATAKVLQSIKSSFSGQVRLFFQQGEEYGKGARLFVNEGLLEGASRVFGAHISSKLDSGKISITKGAQCASCDYFKITITGKGAHVSTPHLGVDAVYIASQTVVNLQSIVARNTNPLDTVIVGVGTVQAGTQYNIVAETAVIEGTTRSFNEDIRAYTNNRVKEIAQHTALMHGATVEVEFFDYAAPLVNHEIAVKEVTEVAETFMDKSDIVSDFACSLGADDFADYLAVTEGMYAFVGTKNKDKPNTCVAHHHGLFDIDEDALVNSCALHVAYTLKILA